MGQGHRPRSSGSRSASSSHRYRSSSSIIRSSVSRSTAHRTDTRHLSRLLSRSFLGG